MSGKVFVVSNTVELRTALDQASGGDRVELKAGDYGDLRLANRAFDSAVMITSHDPEAPARFDSVYFYNLKNVTLDNVHVDFQPTEETKKWHAGLEIRNSSEVTVSNSVLEGGIKESTGLITGRGISVLFSDDITLSGNEVTKFGRGIHFGSTDGIVVSENHVHNNRTTTLSGADVNNVLVESNHFESSHPNNWGATGDHGDFIHFWTDPRQTTPSDNFVIRGNFIAQGTGTAILGIYMDNNRNPSGFTNVLIEDNVIHNGNAQSLLMERVTGAVVQNNTFIQSSGGMNDAPRIRTVDDTRDVLIQNNILSGLSGSAVTDPAGFNIQLVNNLTVQRHDPLADNYIGKLFADALAWDPDLSALRIIPGSIAEGYGSTALQMGGGSGGFEGFIIDGRGEGLEVGVLSFSVTELTGPTGRIDPAKAKVTWDFGDGTRATGNDVAHVYEKAGIYQAQARIELSTGEVFTTSKTVNALTPIAVKADFDTGVTDLSDIPLTASLLGNVKLEDTDLGQSLRLIGDKSAVRFRSSEEIRDNPEFTLSFAFKKDAGAEGSGGRVLYFSGTAVIDLGADSISLRGRTNIGEEIYLRKFSTGISDSDWHQITYTFSQKEGAATLYLDGQQILRQEGLTGIQHVTSGHTINLGNPYGRNFNGVLDDFIFLRGAMSAEQVAKDYAAFQKGGDYDFMADLATLATPVIAEEPVVTEPGPNGPAPGSQPVAMYSSTSFSNGLEPIFSPIDQFAFLDAYNSPPDGQFA